MAGLYVHIPFCKKRCLYCDFFSTTLLERREEYLSALIIEISMRKQECGEPIRTIYIGGGTPSILNVSDIRRIIDAIGTDDAREITIELNPADINKNYLEELRQTAVNRLSIGVQSFNDGLLQILGRRHNARKAIEAVHLAQKAGFDNISIDLMYALPTQTEDMWAKDIETALELCVQHISSYGLMYEEGTVLTHRVEAGELEVIDEDIENRMYDYLCKRLKQSGWEHYEVSNFALPGYTSKHNSSYWNGTSYVGVGAGAHSYLRNVRSWNPDDLDAYINGINKGSLLRESETLSENDIYNERLMLGLRTNKGLPRTFFRADIRDYLETKLLRETRDGHIVATQAGIHILNRIIEDLML